MKSTGPTASLGTAEQQCASVLGVQVSRGLSFGAPGTAFLLSWCVDADATPAPARRTAPLLSALRKSGTFPLAPPLVSSPAAQYPHFQCFSALRRSTRRFAPSPALSCLSS